MLAQRIHSLALGDEDLNDHDQWSHDPLLAGKRHTQHPLAGKSTLNRLELSTPEPTRYKNIDSDPDAIDRLLVDLFREAFPQPPRHTILVSTPRAHGSASAACPRLRITKSSAQLTTSARKLFPRSVVLQYFTNRFL
jgi:hypothetical protein